MTKEKHHYKVEEFIKHRENILVESVEVFNDYLVITEREWSRRFNVFTDDNNYYIDFDKRYSQCIQVLMRKLILTNLGMDILQ